MPKGKSGRRKGKGMHDAQIPQATTIKGANEIAVQLGLATEADFKNMDVRMANEVIAQLYATRETFPDMPELSFVGSVVAQKKWERQMLKQAYFDAHQAELRAKYSSASDAEIIKKHIHLSISHEKLPEGSMGAYYPGIYSSEFIVSGTRPSIVFNEKYFSSGEISYTENLRLNLHEQTRYCAVGSLKGIVNHEIGHRIDHVTGASQDSVIQGLFNRYYSASEPDFTETDARHSSKMAKALSHYANTNIGEFIAEALSEYRVKPNPRPLAKQVGDRIMELYKRR